MKNAIITVILLLSTRTLWAQEKCVDLFQLAKSEATQQLSEEAKILIKLEALVKTSIDIRLNNFENPAQLQQAKEQFEKQLTDIIAINRKYLDIFKTMQTQIADELIITSNKKIREENEERKEKEKTVRETLDPINLAKKLVFHEIMPGTFNLLNAQQPVTITKAYELAQTQTTQLQWSVIQVLLGKKDQKKINPSHFQTGFQAQVIKINGISIQMKPDHPVEQVSYENVMEWITGLNRLSKEGNDQFQKEIQRVIPGHKKGHIYDLPTEAQWAFVMQNRGKNNNTYFDKNDESEVGQYAWSGVNSKSEEYPDGSTREVATKKPREIDRGDGKRVEFYDLEGNLWEWNKDLFDRNLTGGIDPKGPLKQVNGYVVRGGCWYDSTYELTTDNRSRGNANTAGKNVGFRLSRTGP